MATVQPFRSVYYNIDKVKDFKKVTAPPYDVINKELQDNLMSKSPYNFVHIDFNKDRPSDNKDNNKYTRANKTFEEWLKKEIMLQDEVPCLYFYKQEYKIMGQKHSRLGFVGALELEDDDDATVKPHEKTHKHAVDDRLKLTKTLGATLSPIFVCYSDRQKKVEKIFNKYVCLEKPFIELEDLDKVKHKMWRLSEPSLIKEVQDSVSGQQLFIADGHHRYKVACDYRRNRLARKTNFNGTESFNFVMTYFTNMDSKDLQIFPMHRVVKKLSKSLDFLEDTFWIDKIKSQQELLILLAKAGQNEHAFGMYTKNGIRLLRLKNKRLIEKKIKEGSKEFKSLDASILKHFVFDELSVDSADIIYLKDMKEGVSLVNRGDAQAVFIMNPVKIEQLKAIALNGERMPQKSTYFYPKVLSGLTVYKMDS